MEFAWNDVCKIVGMLFVLHEILQKRSKSFRHHLYHLSVLICIFEMFCLSWVLMSFLLVLSLLIKFNFIFKEFVNHECTRTHAEHAE